MSRKIDDWRKFASEMETHIDKSGEKYDFGDVSCVDLDPWVSCVSNAHKYIWEILAWFRNENFDAEDIKENLLKASHYCQIAYTKLSSR